MSERDRQRWDERYADRSAPEVTGPPAVFAPYAEEFPTAGSALDLACGQGATAVWLARRGLTGLGPDVSPGAIGVARDLAARAGVEQRCRFEVVDLDDGLPSGPPADLIVCHKFRDRRLDHDLVDRLATGGLLAISVLSAVDAAPGPFRAEPGELSAAFANLTIVAAGEGDGEAWLLGRRPPVVNRHA